MADFFSSIKPIPTTYPVKPTQPANKDREPDSQRKKRREDDLHKPDGHDSDGKPTIDERV